MILSNAGAIIESRINQLSIILNHPKSLVNTLKRKVNLDQQYLILMNQILLILPVLINLLTPKLATKLTCQRSIVIRDEREEKLGAKEVTTSLIWWIKKIFWQKNMSCLMTNINLLSI